MPALGATPIDGRIQVAIGVELVHAQHGDFGKVRMPRRLRRVWRECAEAAAIAQEVFDLELLTRYDHDVVVEPGSIDDRKARVVERFDVDTRHLGANLAQWPNLNHVSIPSQTPRLRRYNPAYRDTSRRKPSQWVRHRLC